MPSEPLQERFRLKVRDLLEEVAPPVAEEVALAMVRGAAQGFRDITQESAADADRRLLAALDLDVPAVVAVLGH